MFKTLQSTFPKDEDYPQRTFRLGILTRVLEGTIYDGLQHAFHDEKNEAGEYIPLRKRRPSVRYRLCGIVVDDSVSMLFSEGHFPTIECKNQDLDEALTQLVKETKLNAIMIDAATRGSVGSVVILMRVLKGRVFFEVKPTQYLSPEFDPEAPDTLVKVTEKYKVKGKTLVAMGYQAEDNDEDYWFRREWTTTQEVFYLPQKVADSKKEPPPPPVVDTTRTVTHSLGFVPAVWVRNLPGGDGVDGLPTFPDEAIDTAIEVDYLLSQGSRGLKYSSDPTLLIKEPTLGEKGQMVKGAGNALVVSDQGDAKLLEINGTAATAVMEYVRLLRELALESMHGNRASAEKLSAAQSGRAMELMNQALIWLADRLRISYGEGALLDLLKMVVAARRKMPLQFKDGAKFPEIPADADIVLRWPAWYQPTAKDRNDDANTLKTLADASLISEETGTRALADTYDIEDVPAERARIEKEREERIAREQPKTTQTRSV
ncbi:phage portal protein [Cupriavidus gilardii]|uniref:phage portal protein n=1 Tax=Cupriavidus gilardii TaxID=82541 RepID=UPI001ABEA36D|nr:phage portal protein [Cupriavidus gilardii]MBO4120275.1 phage portal protein [Cupriavidus gilardii]